MVVLAHLRSLETAHDDEARRVSQVRLVKALYERGWDAEQIRQLYRRVGMEKGLAEGLAKGREEGREVGREEGLLAGIEVALELKFAAPELRSCPKIRQIDELELLQKVLAAVKDAESSEALRRVWS